MKQLSTEAIILKRINYGEADRILTVLTKDYGQVSMLAKGVRKSKSKLAGGLELFSVIDINYIDGKSNLKTVVSTRLKVHFRNIVKDVDRTMSGYDFVKTVDSFTQHSEESEYFSLLVRGLESLEDVELTVQVTEVWFYMKALSLSGSGINLEKPLDKPKFEENEHYEFSYDDMSFCASESGKFSPNHIKFLRLVSKSINPNQLKNISGHDDLAKDLQQSIKQSTTMHKA